MSLLPVFAYYLDQPSSWTIASPAFEITGWFYPGKNQECRDIRAVVDGVVFLGVYGLDRIDVRTKYPEDPNALRTGFLIRVRAWSKAKTLKLDYLDQNDEWQTFIHEKLDVRSLPGTSRPKSLLRASMVYESLNYLYRRFHHQPWSKIKKAADRVVKDLTTPNTNITAEGLFRGHLENPGFWINSAYDKFRITGWVFHTELKTLQLSATTVVTTENRLIYGKERLDVASHHPNLPQARFCDTYGLVDVRLDAPSPVNLKIFAKLDDGKKMLVFSRRMHLNKQDENDSDVAVYRPFVFWLCAYALFRRAIFQQVNLDGWKVAWQEVKRLKHSLSDNLSRPGSSGQTAVSTIRRDQDPYTRWAYHNRLTPSLSRLMLDDVRQLAPKGPKISIVVPTYNTPEKYLRELLASVTGQLYANWELCIADDASPQPHVRAILEEAAKADARIKPVFRKENGHISRATNSALDVATADYVAFLDHDDVLPHDALLHVAAAIAAQPDAGMLYTDEDKIDDIGRHFDPQFKGAWSPEMAITHNYTHHLTVMRRDLVEKVGRLRPDFTGAQDIDLILRVVEVLDGRPVVHVPQIGYHWRAHPQSTASKGDQKGYLFDAARRAIAEAAQRRGLRAEPFLPPFAKNYALCLHQLKWDSSLLAQNPVTIVIPNKNRVDLLTRCLDSIARTTPREFVKVIVVDDASDQPETLNYLSALPARTDLRSEVIHALEDDGGFDYSRLINLGSARASTPLILHLNNDVEALEPGWLEDMVGWSTVPGVGIVGARLLYPDGMINHGGISIGRKDHMPHVLFEKNQPEDLGFQFLPHAARNVLAVTGACLLTRTDLYRQLGGFDAVRFRVAYNDVDYCLRARAAGFRTVVSPQAVLQHVGSATRGKSYAEQEHIAFVSTYPGLLDPYHSDALDFPPHELRLNPYTHRQARVPRSFHVTVVTHNLKFEGAPIFIFEYARYLSEQPGVSVKVVSPEDGPLRVRFEQAGLPVEIVDVSACLSATTPSHFQAAIKNLAEVHNWLSTDLIVGNTMLTFWAIHLARQLGKPSALYIHESNPVKKFFQSMLPPTMLSEVEAAFKLAARVVFTAKSTRTIFEDLNTNDNFRTLASWIDIDRVEAFMAQNDKKVLRRKHGLPEDSLLVVNIGSVCERKGQHIYVRAIDQFRKEYATRYADQKPIEFIIVGARPGLYMESLLQDIELLGLKDSLRVIDETPDIYDFYRLADVLVCTSFEESFPRVLLEAMAFRLPIVSTNVNGIPEMLVPFDEAYLVPPGDPFKLVDALGPVIDDILDGNTKMTSLAYAHAAREFHKDQALPRHLEITREAFLD